MANGTNDNENGARSLDCRVLTCYFSVAICVAIYSVSMY